MKRIYTALIIVLLFITSQAFSQDVNHFKNEIAKTEVTLPMQTNPLDAKVKQLELENEVLKKLLVNALFEGKQDQRDVIVGMYLELNLLKDKAKAEKLQINTFLNALKTAKDDKAVIQLLKDKKIRE